MGEKTGISWTDHTWNCWIGCTKVSAGCKNCYFFRDAERYGFDPSVVHKSTTMCAPLKWNEPARVFACSWSDFFHEDVLTDWLDLAWSIIRRTPHLTYQILTKRPENITDALPKDWGSGYLNVWLGVTVEDSNNVWRMETLAEIPAALRFVSYEPALGPLPPDFVKTYWPRLGWLIAGGESGPGYRLPDQKWIRDARDQCLTYIPFFFKQWGGVKKINGVWGGDILNGQQWHAFPEMRHG